MSQPDTSAGAFQDAPDPLFDKINELRSKDLGALVKLPQLIICSHEEKGTRSVMEAVTQLSFPVKIAPFTTQVTMRRQPETCYRVAIRPRQTSAYQNANRTPLESFIPARVNTTHELLPLIKHASDLITSVKGLRFGDYVLDLELFGPAKPNLIISDLPYYMANRTGGGLRTQEERHINSALVRGWLRNPRIILVAVVSANMSFQHQIGLRFAATFDEKKERTICFITNFDQITMNQDPGTTNPHVEALKRLLVEYKLHQRYGILPDQLQGTQDGPDERRSNTQVEADFFTEVGWEGLGKSPSSNDKLQGWLHEVFAKHIRESLPGLVYSFDAAILDKASKLPKVTLPRDTILQQRAFLFSVSSHFERILNQALSGIYTDAFFEDPLKEVHLPDQDARRLRALVHELNDQFAEAIQVIGCRQIITSGVDARRSQFQNASNPYADLRVPENRSRASFELEITHKIQRNRSSRLSGSPNDSLVGALLRDQTGPWEYMAHVHLLRTCRTIRECTRQVLHYLTDKNTAGFIFQLLIDPEMEKFQANSLAKLKELTSFNKQAQSLPFTPSTRIGTRRNDRLLANKKKSLPSFLSTAISSGELDSESSAAEIVDRMQECYDASLTTFIENVAILAIENCLLTPLAKILTAETISNLDDRKVHILGRVLEFDKINQKRLNTDLEQLVLGSSGLKELNIPDLPPPPSAMSTALISGATLVVSPSGQCFLMSQRVGPDAQSQGIMEAKDSSSTIPNQNTKPVSPFASAQGQASGNSGPSVALAALRSSNISRLKHRTHFCFTPISNDAIATPDDLAGPLGKTPTTLDFPSGYNCTQIEEFVAMTLNPGRYTVELARYQHITFVENFADYSPEELRLADYEHIEKSKRAE